MRARSGLLAVVLAVLGAGALALASGGGDGGAAASDRFLPGTPRAGAGGLTQAPDANCTQWRAGSPAQRARALRDLEAVFGRPSASDPSARGAVLPRDVAYGVLARACANDFASEFKLWKVYERALGFYDPA